MRPDDEGTPLHPMGEAVLDELDESETGTIALQPGAEARLQLALAKYFERDDLLVAIEVLIAVATHIEQNLKSPVIAGKILSLAVSATPALQARIGATAEKASNTVKAKKAAFSKFTDKKATTAPLIDGKVPDAAMPLVRLTVPTRFR